MAALASSWARKGRMGSGIPLLLHFSRELAPLELADLNSSCSLSRWSAPGDARISRGGPGHRLAPASVRASPTV
jgi:hypothetical protein